MPPKKKRTKQTQKATAKAPLNVQLFQKYPNTISLIILFLLLLIFFHEVIFGGKSLLSPDALTAKSYRPFVEQSLRNGIYPLWNPYIFSGMPSFASLASAPFVDIPGILINGLTKILGYILPLPDFIRILINYFFFGLFMYLLILRKTGVALLALFAGTIMIFQPGVVSFPAFGHNTKLLTALFIPLIFYLVEEMLENRRLFHFGLLSLAVGIQLLRAHVQMSYYTFMLIGLYMLYWTVGEFRRKRPTMEILKSLAITVAALVVGVAMSSWLYLSVREYSHYSIRGGAGLDYGYATSWSFSPLEVLTFFVPSFVGFGGQTYWGHMPFTDYPFYMGLVPLFLAGLAFFLERNRTTLFLGLVALLALIISFGKEFPIIYDLLFRYLPYFNKFRVPSMILILVQFSVAILSAYGLYGLWKRRGDEISIELYRKLRNYIIGFAGFCFLLAAYVFVGKSSLLSHIAGAGKIPNPAIQLQAYQLAKNDAAIMIVLLALSVTLVFLYLRRKITANTFLIAFLVLAVVDLWRVDFKIIHPQPRGNEASFFRADEAVQFLKNDKELYRILPVDNRPANWYMYHFIQNIYGYHAAKLKVYQEMLEKTDFPQGFLLKYYKTVVRDGRQGMALRAPEEIDAKVYRLHENILRVLNVKYILTPYAFQDSLYQVVGGGQNRVFLHKTYLPRAFFVEKVEQVQSKEEVFARFQDSTFDPGKQALIYQQLPVQLEDGGQRSVKIEKWGIHEIMLKTESSAAGFLVLSEVYYPAGWVATIDGDETPIYQTDHFLRGIVVPAGEHKIEFRFRPASFKIGLAITIISFLGSCLLSFFGYRKERSQLSEQMSASV